jgi:hypothetical protein
MSKLSHLFNKSRIRFPLCIAVVIFIAWIGQSSQCLALTESSSSFERPEPEVIRAELNKVLSNPDLRPGKTFKQWLFDKFSKWKKPDLDLSPAWGSMLKYVLVIWCVLTLIAILLHLCWSIWIVGRSGKHTRFSQDEDEDSIFIKDFDELYELARRYAMSNDFAGAIGIMMIALLRKLDNCGTIRFHESKTNSDYLREYPRQCDGHKNFRDFVFLFEQAIYSGNGVEESMYKKMETLMGHIGGDVGKKA